MILIKEQMFRTSAMRITIFIMSDYDILVRCQEAGQQSGTRSSVKASWRLPPVEEGESGRASLLAISSFYILYLVSDSISYIRFLILDYTLVLEFTALSAAGNYD